VQHPRVLEVQLLQMLGQQVKLRTKVVFPPTAWVVVEWRRQTHQQQLVMFRTHQQQPVPWWASPQRPPQTTQGQQPAMLLRRR
jgi:hypothetical protein